MVMASMRTRRLSPESSTRSRVSPAWSCEARFQPESVLKLSVGGGAEVAGLTGQHDAGDGGVSIALLGGHAGDGRRAQLLRTEGRGAGRGAVDRLGGVSTR
jgi:hypothetical protein